MRTYYFNPEKPDRENSELHLLYWGREECAPGHAVGPMVRDVYKIHFIHNGYGIVQVGKNTFSLEAGQAFLIYPDVLTFYKADMQKPWVYSWLAFCGEQVEQILARTRLIPEQPVFPMDIRFMPDMYNQLTLVSGQETGSDLMIKALMYEFLSVLTDTVPLSTPASLSTKRHNAYIVQGMEFIHAHFHEQVSIEQLATFIRLDRKYFSTIFKESVGLTPQQYLLKYRMNKACELLSKGQYTVGEVARSVGYSDALLFSRMFKKIKGIAPKHYRQQIIHSDINP
ncbi:AraC family transcriptional regulator [Bacillus sp. MRMR6]|uniref:AraC family transcriptional regulator n=1 Tax=Bacillus sp. MRMR6 TaxID=1928617 RepID=UPI00095188C0|nr:AraC family transcriptional regulator [Bacillus sp. MRMR6]OLS40757.1 AraC family transcriptional regulator [Bacillus sp. MRMR6]